MSNQYILVDGKPVKEPDLLKWAAWFGTAERTLAKIEKDGVRVSTIFLGLDHSFSEGAPVLWETMIFGGEHDGYQGRYTSAEQAVLGHHRACTLVWPAGGD